MPSPNATDTLMGSSEAREEMYSRSDALNLKLGGEKFLEVIGKRIEDGDGFWNSKLDLKSVRDKNELRYLNQNFEASGQRELYPHEIMYRNNRIFLSIETLASNLVAKIPVPEVVEAQDTDASRELADNYGKFLYRKAQDLHVKGSLQMAAKHLLVGYRLGVVKSTWDFNGGQLKSDGKYTGDPAVHYVRPHKLVIDADTEAEEVGNPPLIAENIRKSVEEIGFMFPDKKDEFIKAVAGNTGKTHVGMNTKVGIYECWFSFFDDDGTPLEGLGWKYKNISLDYGINPFYNYDDDPKKSNFLQRPPKPYTLINFLSIGRWVFDDTSLTEQAASQQDILEKRGRQVTQNADQGEGSKIFNTAQINAKDAETYTGDPRKNILVKGDVRTAFGRVPPNELSQAVYKDKQDARVEIDDIFGTHAPIRGAQTEAETLGQEVMSQRSDLGRLNTLSEAIENGAADVYGKITQLYKVFGTEEQFVSYTGLETGKTTFITFSRDKIEDGVMIRVQPGSLKPDDKLADRNEAVELAKIGGRIDPLSFAEKWHVEKPREFAQRLFYFLFMPDRYAQEVLHIGEPTGDQEAMQTIQIINSGENVPPKKDPTKEYVAYYSQFLKSPYFRQLEPEIQAMHIQHIQETINGVKTAMGEQPKQSIFSRFFQQGQQSEPQPSSGEEVPIV